MLLNSCAKWKKRVSFQKNNNLLLYAIQLVCILKWNKRDSFQKNNKIPNLLQYAIQQEGQFSKKTIYYCMIFNLCVYWNETREAVFKKIQLMTICYRLMCEMKKEGQFSKNNNLLLYAIQLVCVLKWNKRDSFQKKQKTPIYYSMLFNLCAYWNETRWTVFKKKQFITVCYSTCVHIEMKQEGQFSKKHQNPQFITVCYSTRGAVFKKTTKHQFITVCYSTRGSVFKKQQFITICYSTCVCIEMKQGGQFSKKHTIYYSMLFNLCAYWNETRGTVFKKITKTPIYYSMLFNKRGSFQKKQFITVWYSTCVCIEMKLEAVFKKIQLMTICYRLMCEMKKEGQFSKNNNLLLYAIQLVCVLKWNKRDSFQKKQKTPIYYSMLFNLCAYWNETRWTVFKKKQFITVCYSTCVHIEMKQEGQFSKKHQNPQFITVCYSTRGAVFKKTTETPIYYSMLFNKRVSFQKTTIYYGMIFNLCVYWNETRWTVFKKTQFIIVCYSTCVRIEMKQEGQFSKK